MFGDQGSGYPLSISKVTLKWTVPVKILTMGQLVSRLMKILTGKFLKVSSTIHKPLPKEEEIRVCGGGEENIIKAESAL